MIPIERFICYHSSSSVPHEGRVKARQQQCVCAIAGIGVLDRDDVGNNVLRYCVASSRGAFLHFGGEEENYVRLYIVLRYSAGDELMSALLLFWCVDWLLFDLL